MARLTDDELRDILAKPGYGIRRRDESRPCGLCGWNPCRCKTTVRDYGTHAHVVTRVPAPPAESKLEIRFAQQLADHGMAAIAPGNVATCYGPGGPKHYVRNYLDAIPGRNFELDFAWVSARFFVEIDGMAHRTKTRFATDSEKHALLLLAGWRGFRVNGKDVKEGRAIEWTISYLSQLGK